MTVELLCGSGAWLPGLAHTWALRATARRFGSVTVRVPVTSRARLTKSGSFLALRPPLRPVARVLLCRWPPPRPSLRSPRPPAAARPHLLSRPPRPDRTDHLVLLRKLHLPPSPASGPARKPKKIRISPSVPGATSNMNPDAPFLAHSTSSVISPVQRLVPQTRMPALLGAPGHLAGDGPPP